MPIRLALSLHAPEDALRSQIMPVNERYPIAEVLAACDAYYERRRRKVFVEYVMLAGVNDTYEQAVQLARLLDPRVYKVNLIPYNPTGMSTRAPRGRRSTPSAPRSRSTGCARRCGSPAARHRRGLRAAGGAAAAQRSGPLAAPLEDADVRTTAVDRVGQVLRSRRPSPVQPQDPARAVRNVSFKTGAAYTPTRPPGAGPLLPRRAVAHLAAQAAARATRSRMVALAPCDGRRRQVIPIQQDPERVDDLLAHPRRGGGRPQARADSTDEGLTSEPPDPSIAAPVRTCERSVTHAASRGERRARAEDDDRGLRRKPAPGETVDAAH